VKHRATGRFWSLYEALPKQVQALADSAFEILRKNPRHSSLQFKQIGGLWSARVGLHFRALAVERNGEIVWFWIGSHAEYDHIVKGK
jgi:hypothetical protein